MNTKAIVGNLLASDSRILAVGIHDSVYNLLEFEISKESALAPPTEADEKSIPLATGLLFGAVERFQPGLGTIKRISVRFEKMLLVLYRVEEYVVGVGLDPQTQSAALDQIGEVVRALFARAGRSGE